MRHKARKAPDKSRHMIRSAVFFQRPARDVQAQFFSNARLTRSVRQKSLKFVAISAAPSSNCDQTLRSFNACLPQRPGIATSAAVSAADFSEKQRGAGR